MKSPDDKGPGALDQAMARQIYMSAIEGHKGHVAWEELRPFDRMLFTALTDLAEKVLDMIVPPGPIQPTPTGKKAK